MILDNNLAFLQENGFLDNSTEKASLANKLEGKTKQYMNQEQMDNLSRLYLRHVPERYEEVKAKFLEATKDLEHLSGMLLYIEDNQVKSQVIIYDRKHYDEVNSPFMHSDARDRMTKQFVMELKEKYGIKK